MKNRNSEKIGWIGGWLGSFSWVLLLSAGFLVQGRITIGLYGMLICLAAVLLMLAASPWRNPLTPYWKLLIPLYVTFGASIAWAFWGYGEKGVSGLNPWSTLMILPLLTPLFVLGNRKWDND